jgi:myosin heavy subunit
LKLKTLYEVKHASEVATFEKEKAALNVQLERSKANLGDKIILDDRVKKLESELKNLHQEKALYQSKLSFMESNRKSANKTKSDAKVRKLNSTLSDTADISESLKKKLLQQTTNEVELHEKEDEEELKKYEKELCKKSIEAPSMEQQEKFEAKRMSMYLNSTKHLQNEIKRLQQHIQREIKLKNAAMEQVQHLRNQIDQHKEVSIDKMDQSQLNLQYADALKEIAQLKLKLRQRGINDAPYYHLEAPSCPVSPRLQAASVVSTRKYIQAAITAVSNISAHQEVDLRPISTSATGRNAQICTELPRPNTSAVTKDSPRIMALKRFDTKKNEPDLIGVTGVAGPFSPRKPLPYR